MASQPSTLTADPAVAVPKKAAAADSTLVGPSGNDSGPIRTTVTVTVTYS